MICCAEFVPNEFPQVSVTVYVPGVVQITDSVCCNPAEGFPPWKDHVLDDGAGEELSVNTIGVPAQRVV